MNKPRGKDWFFLGNVGVDAGMLMVTDPCYLRHWEDNEPLGHEILLHKSTGKRYKFFMTEVIGGWSEGVQSIPSYEAIVPGTDKTFNQLLQSGEVERVAWKREAEYDYRGACLVTTQKPYGGELHNAIGASLGVAFSSGYGDGVYEVWGRINEDDRIVEVRILMG